MSEVEKKRVLVVDDDDDLLFMMKVSLAKYDFELVGADHATEALTKFMQNKVHCIIVDIGLPNIDGTSLIRWVRETKLSVPIVAISGTIERRSESLEAGADLFFTKPFSKDFFKEISYLVDKNANS